MVCTDICHLKVMDAVLKSREGIAHLPYQVKRLKIRCLIHGMVPRVLLVGEIVADHKPFNFSISTLGACLGIVLLQILDSDIKVERFVLFTLFPVHYAALFFLV